ncbi:MAG TPA: carbohydrate kinase family protein [bacterium]|nr:carbohydrate kinase family protein [bacterium]
MTALDIIVVGELNADLILQDMPSLPEMGKEKLAGNMTLTMGSASAILATNIARLGQKVGFTGKLGDDLFGKLVLETLQSRNVGTEGILIDEQVQTGVTVVLSFPDDYAMVTHMGAMADFSVDDIDFSYIRKAKHLHLSSFYLQPKLRSGAAELFEKAKDLGLTTSLDPGWDPAETWEEDLLETLHFVDVFLPNKQEAFHISGTTQLQDAFEVLNNFTDTIVATQGSKGVLCYHQGETIAASVYQVEPQDTTGAGDSFNAGFLSQWLHQQDIRRAIKYGSACGAIATTKLGGSTASPTPEEVEQFFSAHPEDIFV